MNLSDLSLTALLAAAFAAVTFVSILRDEYHDAYAFGLIGIIFALLSHRE